MKTGIFLAVLFHVAFLLFGGVLFKSREAAHAVPPVVDIFPPPPQPPEKVVLPVAPENTPDVLSPQDSPMLPEFPGLKPSDDTPSPEFPGLIDIPNIGGDPDFPSTRRSVPRGYVSEGIVPTGRDPLLLPVDQMPRALIQTLPSFPAELRGKGIEGPVTVIFIVTPEGQISNLRVENSNHPAFEKPALDAVKQWKYEAGQRAGTKVASSMKVTIRFTTEAQQ